MGALIDPGGPLGGPPGGPPFIADLSMAKVEGGPLGPLLTGWLRGPLGGGHDCERLLSAAAAERAAAAAAAVVVAVVAAAGGVAADVLVKSLLLLFWRSPV